MRAVTLRLTGDEQAGYFVELLDGDPAAGQSLVAPTPTTIALTQAGAAVTPPEVVEFFVTEENQSPDFREIGEGLANLLLPGSVGTTWKALRNANRPLRTYLDIRPPELANLPWELLYHNNPLGLSAETPLVRWRDAPAVALTPVHWQISVLVVVGSQPNDSSVEAEKEVAAVIAAIKRVNGAIDVEVIQAPASRDDLQSDMQRRQPHVIHFIGHGTNVGGEGQLAFESTPPWPCTHQDIRLLLQNASRRPHAVFLNACRTASTGASVSDQDNLRSVAQAFQEEGVNAVIAMQADVPGEVAGRFAERFYTQLAAGDPIDVALARARAIGGALDERTPYLPALTVSSPVDGILEIPPLGPAEIQDIALTSQFSIVESFVDRTDQSRLIFRSCGASVPAERKSLVVVRGDNAPFGLAANPEIIPAGKSSLVHWFLEGCARRRVIVRYVEIAGREQIGWLRLLRIIRDGDPQSASLLDRPLPASAFRAFNWGLRHRRRNAEPPDLTAAEPDPIDDGGEGADLDGQRSAEFITRTFQDFRAGLTELARRQPVVIVLDHFKRDNVGFAPADFTWLRQHLLVPVVRGVMGNVHVVLVLSNDEFKDYKVEKELGKSFADVELADLPKDLFKPLATEFVKLKLGADYTKAAFVADAVIQYQSDQWPASWKVPALCILQRKIEQALSGIF